MNESLRAALRFLRRAAVVTAFGGVGVALWPAASPDPASPAQKAAALGLMRCAGDDCRALQRVTGVAACTALMVNGGIPTPAVACPGDDGFSAPPVAQRPRRLLDCAVRDGAIADYAAVWARPPGTINLCAAAITLDRGQARAWINRLDAASTTAFVDVRPSRGSDVAGMHTWAGGDPLDETDDAQDGGVALDDPGTDP